MRGVKGRGARRDESDGRGGGRKGELSEDKEEKRMKENSKCGQNITRKVKEKIERERRIEQKKNERRMRNGCDSE